MIFSFIVCAYFLIGVFLAEIGFKYLRKNYPSVISNMQLFQFVMIYVIVAIIWLPMSIMVLIKEGISKDEDV